MKWLSFLLLFITLKGKLHLKELQASYQYGKYYNVLFAEIKNIEKQRVDHGFSVLEKLIEKIGILFKIEPVFYYIKESNHYRKLNKYR